MLASIQPKPMASYHSFAARHLDPTTSTAPWPRHRVSVVELLRMIARVDDKKMPFIRVVDLRMESKKHGAILSEKLITAINDRLTKREQTILFLSIYILFLPFRKSHGQ